MKVVRYEWGSDCEGGQVGEGFIRGDGVRYTARSVGGRRGLIGEEAR